MPGYTRFNGRAENAAFIPRCSLMSDTKTIANLRTFSAFLLAPGLSCLLAVVSFFLTSIVYSFIETQKTLWMIYLIPLFFFFVGIFLAIWWHVRGTFHRVGGWYVFWIVIGTLMCVGGLMIAWWSQDTLAGLAEERRLFDESGDKGPPPDYTGMGSFLLFLFTIAGGTGIVLGVLLVVSGWLGLKAKRLEEQSLAVPGG